MSPASTPAKWIELMAACAALPLTFWSGEASAQTSCVPAPQGIVSFWRGEGTGNDSVGTNSATLINGVSFAPGEIGQAFTFNGTSTGLRIPAANNLDVGSSGGLTLEAWIKPTDASLQQDLVEWNDGNGFIGVH